MRFRPPISLLLLGLGSLLSIAAISTESYTESLVLTPFPDGKLHSDFRFDLSGPWTYEAPNLSSNTITQHHSLLPRLLTSLTRQFSVTHFRLTLSSGRWYSHWPLHLPAELPASGIELTAWLELLEGESEQEEQERWEKFVGAVGGLFCAGIEGREAKRETTSPSWAFEFEGEGDETEHRLYRLALPRLAAACTESLTPFLSLLPCASHAGLSSLLNPHRLFDGEWTLIDIGVKRFEEEINVSLGVGSVLDPVRKDRLSGQLGRREFSFSSLYDRTLKTACPVASHSEVQLVVPTDSINPFSIEPDAGKELRNVGGRDVTVWDTGKALESGTLDVRMTWPDENPFRYPLINQLTPLPISTRRLLNGYGQERGRIGIEIKNNLAREIEVIWVETWPWWIRGFVSSLESKVNETVSEDSVVRTDYTPPISRSRPSTLQVLLRLPPLSTSQHTLDYESSTLWYTEYPSDSNRGFSVPGSILLLLDSDSSNSSNTSRRPVLLKLQTPTTLLSLPLPDFSMPYNVIILTSTTIALYFGSIVNGLMRRWFCVDVSSSEDDGDGGGEGKGKEKRQ
ncbi:GPI-anchor transamidase subunit GPI16 [Sporobolomyces salmoneus]|uniref:GPI-anchor transamidase subunit GPI16 n=1 Tax=Sporobolomyces salmoneus TaxID=183962 RepID=UPI003180B797